MSQSDQNTGEELLNHSNGIAQITFSQTNTHEDSIESKVTDMDESMDVLESNKIAPDADDLMNVPMKDLFNGSSVEDSSTCLDSTPDKIEEIQAETATSKRGLKSLSRSLAGCGQNKKTK